MFQRWSVMNKKKMFLLASWFFEHECVLQNVDLTRDKSLAFTIFPALTTAVRIINLNNQQLCTLAYTHAQCPFK